MSLLPLLRAEGIGLVDGPRVIVQDVNLSIRPREILVLLGPNGGGKSTLLKLLAGARRPTEGRVTPMPGLIMGYSPQKLALDAALPLTAAGFLRLGGGAGAEAALERAGILHLAKAQMSDLSGGETQRALLARALMRRPHLLILDEPTQGLDQAGERAFYALLEEIRRDQGIAVLMASHDLHMVMRAADRVMCLNRHICCQGAPEAVAVDPAYLKLFGFPAQGALAPYRHHHDHHHV